MLRLRCCRCGVRVGIRDGEDGLGMWNGRRSWGCDLYSLFMTRRRDWIGQDNTRLHFLLDRISYAVRNHFSVQILVYLLHVLVGGGSGDGDGDVDPTIALI